MNTMDVGRRLVELCKEGKNRQAIEELYADTVDVQEPMPMPGKSNGPRSKEDILKDSDEFFDMMEIHGGEIDGPYPWQDKVIVFMSLDATPKEGPMAGQRIDMREACVYRVRDGKIQESHFCYEVPEGACS